MFLIPYGLNGAGRVVHVNDVPRGKACGLHCPSCEAPLVARKGEVRKHHLAHFRGIPACEGWLHATAKLILYQRFADALASDAQVSIGWLCPESPLEADDWLNCGLKHSTDIFGKGVITDVKLEHFLSDKGIRPDITLIRADRTAVVLVEVVDTHQPESSVIDSDLPVLEIHVSDETDLEILKNDEIPVSVMHNYPCPSPSCEVCHRRKGDGHHYCGKCNEHISPYEHSYCQQCKSCFPNGYDHYHPCEQCGNETKYQRCYCCHLARRLGRVPCYQRGIDPIHRHCPQCHTEIMGDKIWVYDLCYRCSVKSDAKSKKQLQSDRDKEGKRHQDGFLSDFGFTSEDARRFHEWREQNHI